MEQAEFFKAVSECMERVIEAVPGKDTGGVPPTVALYALLEAAAFVAETMAKVEDGRVFIKMAGEIWNGHAHAARRRPLKSI